MALAGIAECQIRLDQRELALATARQAIELAGNRATCSPLARCHLWESHALKVAGNVDAARRTANARAARRSSSTTIRSSASACGPRRC
jgi:hypothetical protein